MVSQPFGTCVPAICLIVPGGEILSPQSTRPSTMRLSVMLAVPTTIGPTVASKIAEAGVAGGTPGEPAVPCTTRSVELLPAAPPASGSFTFKTILSYREVAPPCAAIDRLVGAAVSRQT